MATFLVITNADSGAGSLREAIAKAEDSVSAGKDTIAFAPWLKGQTITLQSSLIIESNNDGLTIDGDVDGDGDADIEISGDRNDDNSAGAFDLDVLVLNRGTGTLLRSLDFNYAFAEGVLATDAVIADHPVAGILNVADLGIEDCTLTNMRAVAGAGAPYGAPYSDGGSAVAGISSSVSLEIKDTYLKSLWAYGGMGASQPGNAGYGGDAVAGIRSGSYLKMQGVSVRAFYAYGGAGGSGTVGSNGGDAAAVLVSDYGRAEGKLIYSGPFNVVGGLKGSGTPDGIDGSQGVIVTGPYSTGTNSYLLSLYGSPAGESITTGPNLVHGLGGDDTITNANYAYGGAGNDTINTAGSGIRAYGGSGNDTIVNTSIGTNSTMDGGRGRDLLDVSQDIWRFAINLETGVGESKNPNGSSSFAVTATGFEDVIGTDQSDSITGSQLANALSGGKGSDILRGQDGKDFLLGGGGRDRLFGGNDNDQLSGGAGGDFLRGNKGNDLLAGNSGKDRFAFGKNDGKDTILDYVDGEDKIDLKKFKFKKKSDALKHFNELGGANDDKVQFKYNGTTIKIKGVDLKDMDAGDIII